MNAVFLTARLKSTRLSRKVLLDVDGIPIIQYLVNRIRINSDVKIILCTSTNKQDDDLIDYAIQNSIDYYRGSEEDVLGRYYQAAKKFSIDKFYIVYGDEPFIDFELMKSTLQQMNESENQFVDNSDYIDGTFGYGMTLNAIKYINASKVSKGLEVWGNFVKSLPNIKTIINVSKHKKKKVRLTIDYKEDLQMFVKLIKLIGSNYKRYLTAKIVDVYLENKLFEINGHRMDDYAQRIKEQGKMSSFKDRLLKAIPGGAHTYSRGFDQYPENSPAILERGEGAYTYDADGNKYLDYGMALRAVNLGYANKKVNQAAIKQIENGNNLTKASVIELEAAELLINMIDSVDMVKFTKNGSTATTAAIKLSRAYTSRRMILRCAEHPFFSYDDWFIGSTPMDKGVSKKDKNDIIFFNYNDINTLKAMFEQYPDEIACVILEPAATEHPKDNFLHKVKSICKEFGAVFILDEMITGFRWDMKGAQHYYDVEADLCTFGKAMANGFSVAAICGKREIMQLGSIERIGQERMFLLSTTHGAEMSGLGAFIETMRYMQEHNVVEHLWQYGKSLIDLINVTAKKFGLEKNFVAGGVACSPYYLTFDKNGSNCLGLRTLFAQEMTRNGVLMPWIALSYAHGDKELEFTKNALENSFKIYKKAVDEGFEKYLVGDAIKPVFRRYN